MIGSGKTKLKAAVFIFDFGMKNSSLLFKLLSIAVEFRMYVASNSLAFIRDINYYQFGSVLTSKRQRTR